ncbi:MAG: aspartate kinase [Alphaproteobacteria bacterium]|nr:MAG: aspartate kinase [Alphaproteobacteria bacterium]
MSLIVAKFGGSSVANIRRVERCVAIVKKLMQHHKVVVVVSAAFNTTNRLEDQLSHFEGDQKTSFHDLVLSTGEQVVVGLFSLALQKHGMKPKSFLGYEVPIITSATPTHAEIADIPTGKLLASVREDFIPVVAGFQGVSKDGVITTLGRGGSDLTAVELAHYLQADECQIYSDVEGVYTSDPKIIPTAQRLDYLTYDEMFQLSKCGAKVLQENAARKALEKKVKVRLVSSFIDSPGTVLVEDVKEKSRFASLYMNGKEGYIVGKNVSAMNINGQKLSDAVLQIDTNAGDIKTLHDDLLKLSFS